MARTLVQIDTWLLGVLLLVDIPLVTVGVQPPSGDSRLRSSRASTTTWPGS